MLIWMLVNHDYEDHYFLEIDRSTESLARIVNTCKKYIEYYRSGIEQRQKEVFPLCFVGCAR